MINFEWQHSCILYFPQLTAWPMHGVYFNWKQNKSNNGPQPANTGLVHFGSQEMGKKKNKQKKTEHIEKTKTRSIATFYLFLLFFFSSSSSFSSCCYSSLVFTWYLQSNFNSKILICWNIPNYITVVSRQTWSPYFRFHRNWNKLSKIFFSFILFNVSLYDRITLTTAFFALARLFPYYFSCVCT